MKKQDIIKLLESKTNRSAWNKGVNNYAIYLIDGAECETFDRETLKTVLLNGAQDWSAYSHGGCADVYDYDIAEALCSPSELKSRKGGEWQPSKRETWLDVQARALSQACARIYHMLPRI